MLNAVRESGDVAEAVPAKEFPPANSLPPEIAYIPIKNLIVDLSKDGGYQRDPSSRMAQIKKIAREWDWDEVGALVVGTRAKSTSYYVVDGWGRATAAKMRGDIEALPCVVIYGDRKRQAQVFKAVNTRRIQPNTRDQHFANVVSGDEMAIEVDRILASHGLRIGKSKTDKGLTAVRAIYLAYQRGVLEETLELIRFGFHMHESFLQAAAIKAASRFISIVYKDGDSVSDDFYKFVDRMRKKSVEELKRAVSQAKAASPVTQPEREFLMAITILHDKNLAKPNKVMGRVLMGLDG